MGVERSVAGAATPVGRPSGRTIRIPVPDGWELVADRFEPEGVLPPRVVVLAGHAMMANRRSLDRPRGDGLASTLARRGLLVYSFDVRGHGDSRPLVSDGGRWDYDDIVSRDLPAAIGFVRDEHPDLKIAVLGHSLAGHAVLAALGRHPELPVSAVVTLGANAWIRSLEPDPARWRRKLLAAGLTQLVVTLFGRIPARAFGVGSEDEPAPYVRQLLGWARRGRWESRDGFDYFAGLSRIGARVLAVAGAGDRLLCAPESCWKFHRPIPRVEPLVVHGADWGLARDPGHMDLVLQPELKPLWFRIADWLSESVD